MHPPIRLQRRPHWRLYLDALVHSRAGAPFKWGANDCALFAAEAVAAITGVDFAQDLRGQNARQAVRTLRRRGGIAALATKALGPACDAVFAAQGDVVLVQVGKRHALGVCLGQTVVGPGRDGLAVLPMDRALCAWRVG